MVDRRREISVLVVTGAAVVSCSLLPDLPDPLAASSSDASSESDAGSDGPSAPRICTATFCDDFDDGALGARWSTLHDSGGTLALDPMDVTSKPNAFHARAVDAGDGFVDREAYVERTLSLGQTFSCEVDVKVLARPTSDHSDVFWVRTTGDGVPRYVLSFGMGAAAADFREDAFFVDGGCDCPRKGLSPPPLVEGKWTHLKVEMDFMRASVSYDSEVVAESTFGGFMPTTALVAGLGIKAYRASTIDVLFDGFSCTVTP